MKSPLLCTIVLVQCGALSAFAAPPTATNVRYSPSNNTLTCDVYAPTPFGPRKPTVILVHGGGYTGGNRYELLPVADLLSSRNYPVVNIEYTLASAGNSSFPAAIRDVKQAIAWVRTTGRSVFGLSNKIVIAGDSAGSTIATTAALALGNALFESGITPPASRGFEVDMVVNMWGRVDLNYDYDIGRPSGAAIDYLGMPNSPANRWLYTQAAAITYVSPSSPPVSIFHSQDDGVIPFQHAVNFSAAYAAAGVQQSFHIGTVGNHGWNPFGNAYAVANQIDLDIQQFVDFEPGSLPSPPPPPPPPAPSRRSADLCGLGGTRTKDSQITIDDLVFFLNSFFSDDADDADFSAVGGGTELDGQLTVDDLIAYLGAFFDPN
jgi:acetyl esterase/lipase